MLSNKRHSQPDEQPHAANGEHPGKPNQRKTVLLSAYACFDNFGSEPGIGYTWLKAILESDYHTTLATSGWSYERLQHDSLVQHPNLSLITIGSCKMDSAYRKNRLLFQLYIYYFQVVLFLKLLFRWRRYDYAHHLTFGGVTIPSFIAPFGKVSLYGPVGGGEHAPWKLARMCGPVAARKELIKKGTQFLTRIDPLVLYTAFTFDRILLKNADNLGMYGLFKGKCEVKAELSCPTLVKPRHSRSLSQKQSNIAFAGRGIYWKGGALAVAMAHKICRERPDIQFHFFGAGGEYDAWQHAAQHNPQITFYGRLTRENYLAKMEEMDLLWFPSFHDSSGNAVLESLVRGVPILAFKIGGPSSIVVHSEFLVDISSSAIDIESEFIRKTFEALKMGPEQLRLIAEFYRERFDFQRLLDGVYR